MSPDKLSPVSADGSSKSDPVQVSSVCTPVLSLATICSVGH